jgi:hypothetical protein
MRGPQPGRERMTEMVSWPKKALNIQMTQHTMYAAAHLRPQLLPVEKDRSGGGRITQKSDGASGGTGTLGDGATMAHSRASGIYSRKKKDPLASVGRLPIVHARRARRVVERWSLRKERCLMRM